MRTVLQSLRALLALTLLTGLIYPLVVTAFARVAFAKKSTGSLVERDGKTIGSALLGQQTSDVRWFWPRPSAGDFATIASGASNKGPTSADLVKAIAERRAQFGDAAPGDLLTASGSGIDPHLSPAAARHQIARVAKARSKSESVLAALIAHHIEPPQLGFLGEPRVNVLALNLALDALP
jgi:K+-transporting ATPase ATPase C chain